MNYTKIGTKRVAVFCSCDKPFTGYDYCYGDDICGKCNYYPWVSSLESSIILAERQYKRPIKEVKDDQTI